MLVVLLSVAVACSDSIGSVEPPVLEPAPEEFTRSCETTVKIPDRELQQNETEALWARDRVSLVNCAEMHQAVIEFYRNRDNLVSNING